MVGAHPLRRGKNDAWCFPQYLGSGKRQLVGVSTGWLKFQAVQLKHVFHICLEIVKTAHLSAFSSDMMIKQQIFMFNFGKFQGLNNPKSSTCDFKQAGDLPYGWPARMTAAPGCTSHKLWTHKRIVVFPQVQGLLDFRGYGINWYKWYVADAHLLSTLVILVAWIHVAQTFLQWLVKPTAITSLLIICSIFVKFCLLDLSKTHIQNIWIIHSIIFILLLIPP